MIRYFLTAITFFAGHCLLQAQDITVMTFNIRLNTKADSLNAWPYRKDKASSQILFHHATIVGVQEALYEQMMDLQQALKGYRYVGVGRTDGKNKGEFSAIFYDTARLQMLETNTFWLAEQTNIPGQKGWDAAYERVVSWALFRDKLTRKKFYQFNTHFDHMGKIARKESAKLLLSKVNAIAGKTPVIVTGDFNAHPGDEPVQILTNKSDAAHLKDTKELSAMPHYGPTGTFNGFQSKEINDEPIDYIFIKDGFRVLQHATLSESWEGRFSSDHFPVLAVLRFK